MTNFSTKMIELFSCVAQFKNKQNKEGKDNHVCKYLQIKQNRTTFQQNKTAFYPSETASYFPKSAFCFFLCFRAESPESTRLRQSIGDAPKFGGLREGFFLVVWNFLQALAKRNQKKRCL